MSAAGKAAREIIASTALYDGRQFCGDVVEFRNGQFEAVLPDGRSIGLFQKVEAAARALLAATRWQEGG